MGIETQFWPFYFRIVGSIVKVVFLLFVLSVAFGYGTSRLSGADYEVSPVLQKTLPLIGVALVAPIIVIVVSYLWWYGSIAIDKLAGGPDENH